jgi:tetratricopeptide (TPR) repeat protein
MTGRAHSQILIAAVAALSLGGIAALSILRALAPTPNLDEIRALARARQFNRAQLLLDRYLQVHPKNERAHLLMAQLATEPTNLQPGIALEHLGTLETKSPEQAAKIKFLEGKAHYQLGRYDLAEYCWTEALRLDPIVPEAGWALIDLLDKEGRQEEAHRVGMRMHEVEPDPRDRVRILLEMSGLDIEAPEAHSQIELFEPLVKQHPQKTRGAYLEVGAIKSLGLKPHPMLYRRMADLREKMGRADEALAWHRLVLRDFPDDALSLAALERLK